MEADNSQLLSQLKDIHAAAAPSWWPPAPSWWLLALLVLLLVAFLLRHLGRRVAVRRRKRQWLAALDALTAKHDPQTRPQEYLSNLNRLFRAVALRAFPDTACARLQGEQWVAFISGLMPEDAPAPGLEALAQGPYEAAPELDASALDRLARTWVDRYG